MPEEVVGTEYSRRCNIVFWVVYTLDREFSALMGAPTSIRDEDITVKLPSKMDGSLDALNMTLHVRLSRLMARILTSESYLRGKVLWYGFFPFFTNKLSSQPSTASARSLTARLS